jgi:hypothetical protein
MTSLTRLSAQELTAATRMGRSRNGPRLTPSSRASSASVNWVPGASSPWPMASRNLRAMMLGVDSRSTGLRKLLDAMSFLRFREAMAVTHPPSRGCNRLWLRHGVLRRKDRCVVE